MTVVNEKFTINTKGFDDLVDITRKVKNVVSNLKLNSGLVNVFVNSSSASILLLESEPGLNIDLLKLLDNLVPINKIYKHDNIWYEGNAHAHLKSSLLGYNITIPVVSGNIEISQYQQIVLIDFDNKPRTREIIVSVVF